MSAVLNCLVDETIGPGEQCRQLVKKAAEYLSLSGGVAFKEYGRAIEVALAALGLKDGAQVIISVLSPVIYLDAIESCGFRPRLVDVQEGTACIDLKKIEEALDQETGAILLHEPLGYVPDLESVSALGIPIIEDISQSIGANTEKKKCGSYGRFVIQNMDPENIVTTGGGTLLLGNRKIDHGEINKRTQNYHHSYFLSDMNAALGIEQFDALEKFIEKRREIAKLYVNALMKSSHSFLVQKDEGENIYFSFPVLLKGDMKEVIQYTKKRGITTWPAFTDTPLDRNAYQEQEYPHALSVMMRCLLFPLYPSLKKQDIDRTVKVLATLP